ncbi:type I methionyl aminopeptidase [Radicibacter daui]|uniref:type I methionyl aminopeptidase n=1 Tax=Radicibacter daui TaxID=3064829 RepID=UPI004046A65D
MKVDRAMDAFAGIETEFYNTSAGRIRLYRPEHFEGMRKAGRLVAEILDAITDHVVPGITTGELDALIDRMIDDAGAICATKGYRGYQHASCISLNHVICHGIPGEKKLAEGDILNIDVTVIVDGWFGDSSRMYYAGDKISVKARKLTEITYDCLMAGIAATKPGNTLGDIGHAIQTIAERNRFSVVRDFCGHGVGRVFHDSPNVVHYGRPGSGPELKPGMFFTIEPMINAGKPESKILSDGWTAVTRDRSLSAQFEHMIGVTDEGCEIFTLSPRGYTRPPYGTSEAGSGGGEG